jgi:hypothetical protein
MGAAQRARGSAAADVAAGWNGRLVDALCHKRLADLRVRRSAAALLGGMLHVERWRAWLVRRPQREPKPEGFVERDRDVVLGNDVEGQARGPSGASLVEKVRREAAAEALATPIWSSDEARYVKPALLFWDELAEPSRGAVLLQSE